MNLKLFTIISFFAISTAVFCQSEDKINITDAKGLKQGHWVKKYPNTNIMYDGYFKDNHPVGEFLRYYEDNKPMSVLTYSPDGKQAEATIYHPNGYIASKGKFVNQLKEGKWKFFSRIYSGYLICEEIYSANIKNGISEKFYPDSTVAERVTYINDIKQGEWIKYYPDGKKCVRSSYLNGKINGKFEVWFETGGIEFSGQYKNDSRDGNWLIFDKDGSVKYRIEYNEGITKDHQMDIDISDFLDSIEKNKGKIADPEKTGVIR